MQIEQIGSFMGVLIIFILILYASYVCSRKVGRMSMKDNQSRYMKLEDRLMLGQDRYIAIVRIGESHYLIGVSPSGIEMLTEIGQADMLELQGTERTFPAATDFKEILKRLGKEKEK